MRRLTPALCAAVVAVLSAGCSDPKAPTEDNFSVALESALAQRPMCFLAEAKRWPSPASTEHPFIRARETQLTALANAGLLRSESRVVDTGRPVRDLLISELLRGDRVATVKDTVTDYHWTETGQAALSERGLCYGTAKLQDVVRWTEPAEFMGGKMTQVTYTYTIGNRPAWAETSAFRSAFREVAAQLDRASEGTATLVLTNEGWRVME
jgi:hypothetical protein